MNLDLVDAQEIIKHRAKYGQRRTWSELCSRWFDSKAEALRGEELRAMELAGEIRGLNYQPIWVLSVKPKITYRADFQYLREGKQIEEDVKGVLTRDSRTRIAWAKQRYGIPYGISFRVLRRVGNGWQEVGL